MLDQPEKREPGTPAAANAAAAESAAQTALHAWQVVADRLWSWRIRAPVAIGVLAVLWQFGIPFVFGPIVPADPVVRSEFVQTVVASGRVEAPFRVNIGSQITGVVADVPVAEGQTVKAGDTLIELDGREARALVVQADGAVAQAEARMRQLHELTLPSAEEGLKQADATLANAQVTFERAKRLSDQGYGTKATLDDATKALDIARAQRRSAEFQAFTNRPGGSDYVMAETLLNQARANLDSARSRLAYTVIKAPRDGVLISRNVERGNVVQPSGALMTLSPLVDTQLVVQIDEKNLGLLQLGQKAIASADAYSADQFPAEVVYINPGIDLQRASVQVKLRVPAPPAYLRQDMTVSVDIETARKPDALVLPSTAIRGLATGKPWVLAVEHSRAVRRVVKIGLTGGGRSEIVDGLKAGGLVLAATAAVKEGARVRARTPARGTP